MTHKDIYTKFVIEYDKANVTSSYPSLTEYEIATVLDKAYVALIAQKITGNNYRRSVFESDVKSIADLEPLVQNKQVASIPDERVPNSVYVDLEKDIPDMLYYVTAYIKLTNLGYVDEIEQGVSGHVKTKLWDPADDNSATRSLQIKLVSHDMATKFFVSPHNIPWVKDPVCYIENKKIHIVYDPINKPKFANPSIEGDTDVDVVYIKNPNPFVKKLDEYTGTAYISYFDYRMNNNATQELIAKAEHDYHFECNSTMAEELVSLAVAFALENIESARLNSKLNMRGLEA